MCVHSEKVQAQVAAYTNHPFRAKEQECASQNDAACKNDGRRAAQKPCPLGEQSEPVSTRPTESREKAACSCWRTEGISLQTACQQTRPPLPSHKTAPLKLESSVARYCNGYHVTPEWQMLSKCQRAQGYKISLSWHAIHWPQTF